MNGTVKVGRWDYPAVQDSTGSVKRNTKRDGTGEWVEADAAKFEGQPEAGAVPEQRTGGEDLPNIDGFTAEGSSDYDDLRVAYGRIFDDFAVTYGELTEALGVEVGRAKAIVSMLRDKGLVVTDERNEAGEGTETVIQSYKTYDDHTRDEVMADFAEAFQPGVKIRRTSGHGGKVGAQTKKPGKSSWTVGDTCPQGVHRFEKAEDIYVMPSGRRQCRKCRAGYPSNIPASVSA